jgi:hypothetical protein
MLLSARILNNVTSVNGFEYVASAEFTEGDAPTITFQLIDKSLDRHEQGFSPAGRRYMPAANATLQVVLPNINASKTVTRFATQPYANDPSIWQLTLQTTDQIRGTLDMQLTLTEGAKVTRGVVHAAITCYSQTQGL